MSLANEKTKKTYTGNGSTTVFPFDFKVFNKAHLLVLVGSTEMTVDVDYTVSGVGETAGGSVIFDSAPDDESTVVLMRAMTAIQETEYTTSGAFPATAHEAALDRLTMLVQQLNEKVNRMPLLPVHAYEDGDLDPLELPTGDGRMIGWNSTGDELQTYATATGTITSTVFDSIDNYDDNLHTAISEIGSTRTTLVIDKDISITDNASTPKTLRLMPINDAKINIPADKILLVYSPYHFIASPNQQIHGNPLTGGALTFLKPGKVPVAWYGDNTSSSPIQLAVNGIDAGEIEFNTEQHTITISDGIGVRVDKSNLKFTSTCRTEFIHDGADIDGLWFDIGAESSDDSFVQVHDITFDGLVMTGSATSTSTTQVGIYAKAHSNTYTAGTDGSYNITVKNCKITGFTMSTYLVGVHNVDIGPKNELGGNVFITGVGKGGYGVLLETVCNAKIHHNDFISDEEDRHGFYLAFHGTKTGSAVQNYNIQLTDNYFAWGNTVKGTNGYRQAVNVRCTYGFLARGNIIRGSMQYGMAFNFDDGHGADYTIIENIITDVRVIAGTSGGGIVFIADATYAGVHAIVKNNTITESSTDSTDDFRGIQINGIDAIVGGNKITAYDADSIGIYIVGADDVILEPNEIELNTTARSGVAFTGTCDNITIHKQDIKQSRIADIESLSGVLTNIHYEYSRRDYDVTPISTISTGEDALRSVVIRQHLMSLDNGFKITAAGTKTNGNGGNNKTLKFHFGATAVTFSPAANDENDWRFEAYVFNIDSYSAQGILWVAWNGDTPKQGYATAAVDTTAANTLIKITGETDEGTDDITQTYWLVEHK